MSKYPDEGSFPNTKGGAVEVSGINDSGYHDKKGTPSDFSCTPSGQSGYVFNQLPPGDNIQDQKCSEAGATYKRLAKTKKVTDMGYPGDGGF